MDLRGLNITVGELMRNDRAAAILRQAFPQLAANRLVMGMARGMTVRKALTFASTNGVSKKETDEVLRRLEAL